MNDWFGDSIDIDDKIVEMFINGDICIIFNEQYDKIYTKDELIYINSVFFGIID